MSRTPTLTSHRPPPRRRPPRGAISALLVVGLGAVIAAVVLIAFGGSVAPDRARTRPPPRVHRVSDPPRLGRVRRGPPGRPGRGLRVGHYGPAPDGPARGPDPHRGVPHRGDIPAR